MPGTAGGGHSVHVGGGHVSVGGGSHVSVNSINHTNNINHVNRTVGSSGCNAGMLPLTTGNTGGRGARGNASGKGCLTGVGALFAIPAFIVIAIIFVAVIGSIVGRNDDALQRGIVFYSDGVEKLSPDMCEPLETCVSDEIGLLTAEDAAQIEDAIDAFYKKTGVQPYLMVTDGVNGDINPDYDTANAYLTDAYIELFGSDEGHLLFLICLDGDEAYINYIPGLCAEAVTDGAVCEAVMAKIENALAYGDKSDIPAAFCAALSETAEEYFGGDGVDRGTEEVVELVSENIDDAFGIEDGIFAISMLFFPLMGFVGVLIVLRIIKKNKNATPAGTNTAYRPVNRTNTPASGSYRVNTQNTYNKSQHNNYGFDGPVTCPHCGAFDYPRENGVCKYCDMPVRR